MLVDARLADDFEPAMFDVAWWRANGSVTPMGGGRGGVHLVGGLRTHSNGDPRGRRWVLRHFRRGGYVARWLDDRYVFCGENRTRSFREWRLLADLYLLGLPAPQPVAARYLRRGLRYEADILTVQIANARPLSAFVTEVATDDAPWATVGATIRRFHNAGIYHADLNAHNILVDAGAAVYLLDFDRGRRRAAGQWQRANLDRLRRSLDKISGAVQLSFPPRCWQAIEQGYSGHT